MEDPFIYTIDHLLINMSGAWLLGIVILLIWYVYTLQYSPTGKPKMFLDEVIHQFQTGDLILFKAYNNYNSLIHTSYYGHVGIIFVGDDGIPMLFEANGIEHMPLKEHHPKSGIFYTPLEERMKKYKGMLCWKRLNKPLSVEDVDAFRDFITYCMDNMKYDMSVVTAGLKKYFGVKRCGLGTNCGDIVFLSLIKLGLLPIKEYETPRLNHLKYVANLEKLQNGYRYLDLIEIIDHPFAE